MLISMCSISYVDWGASQQASGQSQASPQQKPLMILFIRY